MVCICSKRIMLSAFKLHSEALNSRCVGMLFLFFDDAAYVEDIPNLELAEGNKIWQLNDHNWFETKLLLEERDTESNYLVYAPFARPEDKENSLVDIFYYSEHFYTTAE